MTNTRTIKIKALFLILVFSLNTLVGFACAIGINMGFNSEHHDDANLKPKVHIHADGKKHVHHSKKGKHDHGKHHHDNSTANHNHGNDDDNCCNDKSSKFDQLDKSTTQSIGIDHPVFLTTFVSSYLENELNHPTVIIIDNRYFFRSYHPPIPDIRIAIQSFQI